MAEVLWNIWSVADLALLLFLLLSDDERPILIIYVSPLHHICNCSRSSIQRWPWSFTKNIINDTPLIACIPERPSSVRNLPSAQGLARLRFEDSIKVPFLTPTVPYSILQCLIPIVSHHSSPVPSIFPTTIPYRTHSSLSFRTLPYPTVPNPFVPLQV